MIKKIPTHELIEKNVGIMAEKRGLSLINKDASRNPDVLTYEFSSSEKKEKAIIFIVIIEHRYLQGEDFAKLLQEVYSRLYKKYEFLDFLVIVPNDKETNTFLLKRRDAMLQGKENLRINLHPYHYFTSNILEHISVGQVKILSKEEKEALLIEHASSEEKYNTDFRDKVIPVWLGAEHGDIIQYSIITRGGIDYNYTRIV